MARAELELQQAILGTSLVQPVSSGSKGGTVWVLSRQLNGQEKPWLKVVGDLLEAAEESAIDIHICRRYVRKAGKMVFGWHISINSKGVKEAIADIAFLKTVFDKARPSLDDISPPPAVAQTTVRRAQAVVESEDFAPTYSVPGDPKGTEARLAQGAIKITRLGKDENGDEMTVEEMALPHVTRELNVPKHRFGRGARYLKDTK